MPIVIAMLLQGLRLIFVRFMFYVLGNLPAIFVNLLVGLGFYFVVAKPVASFGIEYVMNKFTGTTGTVLETLYYLNMDDWVQIVFAAYAGRKTMDAGKLMLKKH